MKKLILSTVLAVGFAGSVLAQGFVYFDTSNNTSTSPTATSNGQWWSAGPGGTTLLAFDVNAALYGSATGTAGSFTSLATLLLGPAGNGTAAGDITFYGLGSFSDQTGKSYGVSGATSSAFFYIQAWTGNFSTLAAAQQAGGQYTYDGSANGIFSNPVAVAPATPDFLTGAPAIILTVPEPGTFAIAGLGAAALLIFRRRK